MHKLRGRCGRICTSARREYRASTATPALARQFGAATVIALLEPTGWDVADDVSLVISELVTASVRAEAETVSVQIEVHRTQLSVAVTDDRTRDPDFALAPAAATAGIADPARSIVQALTTDRGSAVGGNGRTMNWAQVRIDPTATTRVDCRIE